jgi:hypothetical protein
VKPENVEALATRWHGRLEVEGAAMTLAESQLALAALASLCAGEREAIVILRRLIRRVRPTLAPGSLCLRPGEHETLPVWFPRYGSPGYGRDLSQTRH